MYRINSNIELRDVCRRTIETLEKWLRRLIDQQLRNAYGPNYLQHKDIRGNYIIKKTVRESVEMRRINEPRRYPREIDAVLLDEAVSILLHPNLYNDYFREPLNDAFPIGTDMARHIFERIIEPRNYLAHANHISFRQAERILCYSQDIIDSIKNYYEKRGEDKLYNAPTIIQTLDSLGNIHYDSEINDSRNGTGGALIDERVAGKGNLHPGDNLTLEVEIDPAFHEDNYYINWVITSQNPTPTTSGKRLEITIDNSHVREDFAIYCIVKSNQSWHRLGDCDERLTFIYRVLPPV